MIRYSDEPSDEASVNDDQTVYDSFDMDELEESISNIVADDNFEVELPSSLTTVHVMKTEEIIPVPILFSFCPITHIEVEEVKIKNRKIVLPPTDYGTIVSVRYGPYTRGVKRSDTIKAFRNSVTFDISTGPNYISIKFSMSKTKDGSSIHIAGKSKSIDEIRDLIGIIVSGTRDSVQWFTENCDDCIECLDRVDSGIYDKRDDNIREYVMHFAIDFKTIGGMQKTLIKLKEMQFVYPKSLTIKHIKLESDKYKFRIDDSLNLITLARSIEEVINAHNYNGIILIYNNMIHKKIIIKIATKGHTRNKGWCTIGIFKTGTVEFSSRYNKDEATRAYAIFRRIYLDTLAN
jgi:hypothetical protein